MNELRPCAPFSLKHVLAQELVKGLQAVSDSLLRYNTGRMLREHESTFFLSLCRAFVEVAFPHCATCFGRCYPGGAVLIMDAKNFFDGLGRLLATSSSREPPKPTETAEEKVKNGETATIERIKSENMEDKEQKDLPKKQLRSLESI